MNTDNNYGAEDLTVMSDIGHIRKRSGMYIGEPDSPKHLLQEAFDNGLDESQNGYADSVVVEVDTKKLEYSVTDNGRGIPIGLVRYNYQGYNIEMESLKALVSVAKSGGKFNSNNYKISGGLHGLGMCCITALSEHAEFQTRRDGQSVTVRTSHGVVDEPIKETTTEPNGVTVKFKGDSKIFESEEIPMEYILNMCNVAKAFGHNVKLIEDKKEVDLTCNELYDLLPVDKDDVSEYCKFSIDVEGERGTRVVVAIKYTSEINSKPVAYTNLIPNRSGGTHVKSIQSAIESVWSEFYNEAEDGVELKDHDCRLGIRYLVGMFIDEPAFSSQTKDKLSTSASSFSDLIEGFKVKFREYLLENEPMRKALIKRFSEYRKSQNHLLAKKEIMSLIKINEPTESTNRVRRRSVVPNLWECKSSKREGTQLYIVEGNSAAGGLARARNRVLQAILPLRGKIKNVAYLSIQDALKSETVRNIINAVGAGVGESADPARCRYDEIFITADADPDGKHITALVASVFINLAPSLVKAGIVKVVHAPLYGWTEGSGKSKVAKYSSTFEDIPKELRGNKGFTRYKGLGEMDDDEVRDTLLNKDNQIVSVIEYPSDVDKFNAILGTSWGKSDLLKELGIIRYA